MSMLALGVFGYREAIEDLCFLTVLLINLTAFERAAHERGLLREVFLANDVWETLDREDLLPPVAYALHGFSQGSERTLLAREEILLRDDLGHVPWRELRQRAELEHAANLWPLYSRWHSSRSPTW